MLKGKNVRQKKFPISLIIILLTGIWLPSANKSSERTFSIFTIGDSTMANKKPDVYPEMGWCQVLGQYFKYGVTIHNHAVNGRSTKSFLDEGRWQVVLDSLKPDDYVFIQFGHNDQKKNDSSRFTTPFGTYAANLEKFVIESRAKGATPVLFTPIVRRKFGENGKLNDTHGDYPDAMRQVARKLNVPLVDMQKMTEEWINYLGERASKDIYLWTGPTERFPEGRKDNTHLSVEGANSMARIALTGSTDLGLGFEKWIEFP